jgi:hypothetical protein
MAQLRPPRARPMARWSRPGKFRSSVLLTAKWRQPGKFRSSGRVLCEKKRIKLAPSAPVAGKTRPDGPKTTGVWAEFYAFALPGPFARISP